MFETTDDPGKGLLCLYVFLSWWLQIQEIWRCTGLRFVLFPRVSGCGVCGYDVPDMGADKEKRLRLECVWATAAFPVFRWCPWQWLCSDSSHSNTDQNGSQAATNKIRSWWNIENLIFKDLLEISILQRVNCSLRSSFFKREKPRGTLHYGKWTVAYFVLMLACSPTM